ncbi:MAG: 6,7-dimethyl-8-ribityllumazine synthase [Wenzhouxiangella sp.]|jgi:6,7-dimethyl-8-ribityllumazine synthase|nr:6,7-dimethyl-8-ribityllumazine synthase [Wenzhouxiangella sp.]
MNQTTQTSASPVRRIAIVVARFNAPVTGQLLQGCRDALLAAGLDDDDLRIVHVPGAWELPLACRQLASSGDFEAVIALGAVIRGETAHFDFISAECARGLMQVSLETDLPVAFGVITPENAQQARDRADPARKNKGREAALAALEMIALKAEIDSAR